MTDPRMSWTLADMKLPASKREDETKMATKNEPGAFDCYAKALPDEPLFTLLARDPSAPAIVMQWAKLRANEVFEGKRPSLDIEQVKEAIDLATAMMKWREQAKEKWRERPETSNTEFAQKNQE